jgi:hypothetical protein
VVAELEVDEDAQGEVGDEGDGEPGGAASPGGADREVDHRTHHK